MLFNRSVVLPAIGCGTLVNFWFLYQFIALWLRVRSEAESEWEGSSDNVRTLGTVTVAYLVLSTTAYILGFLGVLKRIPSYVRLFLYVSLLETGLYTLAVIITAFVGYRPSEWRESACEQLSTQPDLVRSLADAAGFNLDTCEGWMGSIVGWVLVLLSVGLLFKLQFTLAISTYYSSLSRTIAHPSRGRAGSRRLSTASRNRLKNLNTSPPRYSTPSLFITSPTPIDGTGKTLARGMDDAQEEDNMFDFEGEETEALRMNDVTSGRSSFSDGRS